MMALNDTYAVAIDRCDRATNMVRASNDFYSSGAAISAIGFTNDFNNCIIEGAFIQVFTAFESFLEESFICYMMGQSGLNGNAFTRYVTPVDDVHARNLVIGISRFADFTNRDTILKLAGSFFENGGSYECLNSISSVFEEMKKIRNAITHVSKESKSKFEDLVRTKLGGLPTGITTASFLNSFVSTGSRITYYSHYKDTIVSTMSNIANPI